MSEIRRKYDEGLRKMQSSSVMPAPNQSKKLLTAWEYETVCFTGGGVTQPMEIRPVSPRWKKKIGLFASKIEERQAHMVDKVRSVFEGSRGTYGADL